MLLAINPLPSFAEQLDVFTDSTVYTDGHVNMLARVVIIQK